MNGKFFSGLTDKMMNRGGSGPDRQKSNMYWPDEENLVPANEYEHYRPSRNPRSRTSSSRNSSISFDSQNSFNESDVNTKELVKKQQESKIQFYDYDQDYVPPSRTITPSSVGQNQPSFERNSENKVNRKLQTLKSRIEFYDYADDNSATMSSNNTSSKPQPSGAKAIKAQGFSNDSETKPNSPTKKEPKVTNIEVKREQESSKGAKKHLSNSVIDLSKLDITDDEIEELKRLKKQMSKDEIDKKLSSFQTNLPVTLPKTQIVNGSSSSRSRIEQNNAHQVDDAPNEARRNAHRHLKSSIFLNDGPTSFSTPKSQPSESERRSYSIRDTAVCRVGVGLPDL